MIHGTEAAFARHRRNGEPFPEDTGGISCGCKRAASIAQSRRAKSKKAATIVPCKICGEPSRLPRAICSYCHRRGVRLIDMDDRESPAGLSDGRWVTGRHGIQRWQPNDDARRIYALPDGRHWTLEETG